MSKEEEKVVAHGGKYLTFKLAEETYGLDILQVQEIIGLLPVTHVPRTPNFVRGVINLRGKVIPVIDTRIKFGIETIEDTELTCIIVLQLEQDDKFLTMGIVVDEVSEVNDLDEKQIDPPPTMGTAIETDFITGLAKVEKSVIMLLNMNKAFSTLELEDLKKEEKD